jgi:transglutaminase-like putative cysteine protease
LFTYTTSGQPQYLRLLTLDMFDGTSWRASAIASTSDTKTDKTLPAPPGVTVPPSASVETNVTITGLREPYLAVPGTPTAIKAKGTWIYNPITSVVYSKRGSTVHLSYRVTSNTYNPSQSYLASLGDAPGDASVNNYLAVPNDLPASIQLQADQVVADAHATTAFDKAMALQSWFLSAFTYDLRVKSGSDASALESFLSDKRGYCQQFAATMALMARLEGIPARVDIGFTPGAKVNGTSTYLVTTADAHAWPELYFKGAGWLRFEPTPRADGQTSSPSYATGQATTPSTTSPSTARPTTVPTGPGAQAPDPIAPKGTHKVPGTVTSITHVPTGWLITLGVIVLLILASPGVRLLLRRRRWTAADTEAARAHAAWEELGDDLRDLRLDWHGESDTPRRAAAALVATRRLQYDTTAQQALARLTRAEELARYAARPDELRWVDQDPRADQESVRRALFGSVSRTRRLRARFAPSSTGRLIGSAAAWASERIGELSDVVRRWLRDRLPRSGGDAERDNE